MQNARISPTALGLALGVLWGFCVLIVALIAHFYTYGVPFVTTMGAFYKGYEASVIGSLVGAVFAFIDGFIIGLLLAWLYNFFAKKCRK